MTDKQTVKFGNIAEQILKRVNPMPGDEKVFIGLQHLVSGDLKINKWGGDIELSAQAFSVLKGDLIFARRNTYLKRIAVSPINGICSGDAMVIRPKIGLVAPGFLPLFMQSELFMNKVISISSGSLSSRVKWKDLEKLTFEIPAIEIQEKIVAIQQKIQNVVDLNEQLFFSAKKLLNSLVEDTFTPLVGWKKYTLDDLCDVKGGRQRSPQHTTGLRPYKYLRPANIKRGAWKFDDINEMDFSSEELEIYSLKTGDVLVVEGGEAEDVGDSAYWRGNLTETICFQNTLIRLRAISEKISSGTLFWLVTYLHRSGKFRAIAAGTKIKHIGTKNTSLISVDLPEDPSSLDFKVGAIEDAHSQMTKASEQAANSRYLYQSLLEDLLQG